VRDLTVAYGATVALAEVSFEVAAGDVVAVRGGSRSGKTSLLRAVSGLLGLHGGRVVGGEVVVDGRSLVGSDAAVAVRLGVSHVLAGRRVFRDLTVEENLRVGAARGRRGEGGGAPLAPVLDRFPELARRRSTRAGYLSGGEQQLLVIGRALMAAPRLLLLDEPFLGLAPVAVRAVSSAVADVVTRGAAVVVAEQQPIMADARPLLLDGGRFRPPLVPSRT
jgi:branched-chain amino acid transport system ATP-binding protein